MCLAFSFQIISDKGQLYTFGDGRHGKLGLGQESFSNQFTPQRVKRFSKFNVEKVGVFVKILISDFLRCKKKQP